MKVIFLDIDGVLNRLGTLQQGRTRKDWHGLIGMEPELVKRFNTLIKETGAKVVLSSAWRGSDIWKEDMRQNGLRVRNFIDRTGYRNDLRGGMEANRRGHEIQDWIDAHPEIEKYAIIDDDSDMLPTQMQSFFKCDHITGFDKMVYERVKRHLGV